MSEGGSERVERVLYVERVVAENLAQALSGEGDPHIVGITGPLANLSVQDGWTVVSHTFEVVDEGAAGVLTVVLERRPT